MLLRGLAHCHHRALLTERGFPPNAVAQQRDDGDDDRSDGPSIARTSVAFLPVTVLVSRETAGADVLV